jgi:hypothetical protein
MNAAHRSVLPQQRRSRKPAANSRVTRSRAARSSTVTSMPSRPTGQKVERLNTAKQATPSWLSALIFIRRSSDLITFLLVAATLALYSWTVYTQQQWSQEYRKLETLQRHERNLTTTNEVMKNQLAQQAEKPATGLVNPTQANAIVLPAAPQRPFSPASTQKADPEPAGKLPLGY